MVFPRPKTDQGCCWFFQSVTEAIRQQDVTVETEKKPEFVKTQKRSELKYLNVGTEKLYTPVLERENLNNLRLQHTVIVISKLFVDTTTAKA